MELDFAAVYTLKCNDFGVKPRKAVLQALQDATQQEENTQPIVLSLPGNKIPEFKALTLQDRLNDADIFAITETMGYFLDSCFIQLDVSYHAITDAGARAIMILLGKTKHLQVLNVTGNNISQDGCSKIAQALVNQSSLTHLYMKGNPLTDAGIISLAQVLSNKNNCLTTLDVSDTDIGIQGVIELMSAVNNNHSIHSVAMNNLYKPSLQEESTIHVAKNLSHNTSLRSLSMEKHQIRDHGAEWLANHAARNASLLSLNLRCNQIGAAGAESFAKWLEHPDCVLQELSLSSNRLTDLGAKSLARALMRNRSLRSLDLSHCSIGDEGLCVIAEAMRHNYFLQKLYLYGNHFDTRSQSLLRQVVPNLVDCDFVQSLGIEEKQ